jgi:hypothetical protein
VLNFNENKAKRVNVKKIKHFIDKKQPTVLWGLFLVD